MNEIRLLWVEDAAADRVLYRELLSAGDSNDGWLERVGIEDVAAPLPEIGAYAAYDGVVLDLHLGGVSGLDVAARIHAFDWRLPILLLTGAGPGSVPHEAYADVDEVAYKAEALSAEGAFYWTFKRWVRWIARVKAAR